MAEKTETPKVIQHLICDDERNNWKVVDIAVVSPTSVTVLLQNDREWCIDTFDCVENEYQRRKRICFKSKWKEPPLFLSYGHVENQLKHLICTKTKLHFIDGESESIERSVSLSANLSAFCVQGNKVYIFSNEAKAVMFFKLELPTETSKIYFKEISKEDSIVEFVVHSKNIYVCTKRGKVSSYKETGDKRHDYRNRKSKNSTACGLAVFKAHVKECDLLLVTWNDNTLHVYSTNTNHDLLHITLNIPGKFKFSLSCFLMSSEVNNVAVYNTKTVADRGIFKMTLFSGSRSEDLNDLHSFVLHAGASMGPKPEARKLFMKRENLRTLVEMYDSSCYTIDKLHDEKKKLKILLVKKQKEVDVEKRRADEKAKELNEAKTHAEGLCRTIQEKEDKCSSLIKELSENLKVVEKARTESDDLQRMNEDKEEKCRSLTQQLEAERKTTMELKDEIDRSKKEKDDVTEELENTKSKLSRKEVDLLDVRAKLDDARTENDDLRRMNEEKEKKCCRLTKQLESERKTTEEGGITEDIFADSTEKMKTDLKGLIDGINDDTVELKKKKKDVMKELESTNSTLEKKKVDRSQIKDELDAAISKKKELEKSAVETDELKQIIEAQEKEIKGLQMRLKIAETEVKNAKTQVTILQERKEELVNSVSREQEKSEKLEGLLSNLEDANNRLKIEHDKAEKTQTLLSKIVENLDRDALSLKTESVIVKEILQTKGKQQDMLVCLQSDFNSRIEKLKREAELLEYKMGQQNKIIDFEKKNRSALPDMVEQSCTYHDKQEVTAMGLEHKALPDNANTVDKETMLQTLSLTQEEEINMIRNQTQSVTVNTAEILGQGQMTNILSKQLTGPMTKTPKENKKELVEKGSTEENVSKIHHDSNLKPLTPKRLPEDEQTLETKKEGVTEMTSFQAGTYSWLEQIQNFRVAKEKRQLSSIENKLQGVQDKVKYETFQYEYLKDMFESSDNLLGVFQQSSFLKTVDALVKEISNGKDKLGKLKDNRDNTVEEYEVQRDWLELHELQVSLVVSQDGGKLKIPGSNISLDIPPGAMQEQREIQMKIIPHCLDPGGDPISFSSNSSVVVELLPNKLQFQKTVHLRLPHCLHLNDKYNSLKDAKVLISHHDKDDAPNWDVSTDTECKLEKDHCVIPLKKFCWITCRVDDKVVTAKRLKIFTAGRDLELSDRVSEVEVGYFPDLPGSGEILRKNPKLSRGQIKPFLFHKNEEGLTLQISLQQVIPNEWQNDSSLGNKQIISYHSICTGTEMSCPFHLQYTPEGSPRGKVPLCLFLASQENAEEINITFRPEVKCDED